MPTQLPGDGICIGSHSVCLLRAARLNPDCSPEGGDSSGIITTAIVTLTATPDVQDDTNFEPESGCGDLLWTYSKLGKVRRYNLTGSLGYHDWEAMQLLFGGTNLIGNGSSGFDGEVIGWAQSNYTEADPPNVYLEIFTPNVGAGVGECATDAVDFPSYSGHIFGKARLRPDAATYERAERMMTFTGVAESNPNLGTGPWEDYPATGTIPNSPYFTVAYSDTAYDAILAEARCGFADLADLGSS